LHRHCRLSIAITRRCGSRIRANPESIWVILLRMVDHRHSSAVCATDFHQALRRSGDRWYAACLNITRAPALAEDAVQDGLVLAWRKRHQFNGEAAIDTWIHRIVVNAALQLLRRNKAMVDRGPTEVEHVSEPIELHTPADARARDEWLYALERLVAVLTDYERICFVLKHVEEWQLSEIADETGNSVNSVKQALFRAVKKLRVGLADWRIEA